MRNYFMKTDSLGFSIWKEDDLNLAYSLWGEEDVTKYICASGVFSKQEVDERLKLEIHNQDIFKVQYWPIFEMLTGDFIGCCGLRPFPNEQDAYEIGFHLRKPYWGKGFAKEAAKAVIDYAFFEFKASKIYAGHHPENKSSRKSLQKLGFMYIGDNYYPPTGLNHPSYELVYKAYKCNEHTNIDLQQIVRQIWEDTASQNADKMITYFAENAVINWHNTNESFYVEEYIRANCEYPGEWIAEVERIEQKDNLVISVTKITLKNSDTSFHATSFFEFEKDKVVLLNEYWGDDGFPPKWRLEKKIGRPIR